MSKLDLKQDYQAKLPRTGFDMSQTVEFTSSTGMILPLYHQLLNPGESIKLNCNMFTRIQPISTAAMADIDFKLDAFFVPLTQLYLPFQNMFFSTDDFVSSTFSTGSSFRFAPLLNFNFLDGGLNKINLSSVFGVSEREFLDAGFEHPKRSLFRLLMHLGYNPFVVEKSSDADTGLFPDEQCYSPSLTPWYLCAYQAIYQNHYRNDDREKRNVRCYNFDTSFNTGVIELQPSSVAEMLLLRYHQRPADYFRSVKVSPIMSSLNTIPEHSLNIYEQFALTNSWLSDSSTFTSDKQTDATHYDIDITQVSTKSNLSTGSIRNMFAVEKLLRVMGRASKNYDSQVLAHFGFKVPHDVKHQLSYLGSWSGSLHIGEVVSTSNTADFANQTGSPLGEIAGRGTGQVSGRSINFKAPCHGILMVCGYSSVRPSYTLGRALDKSIVQNERYDFYIPEFDRLGAQPLFNYESSLLDAYDQSTSPVTNRSQAILGWQYRYEQYKRKYNIHSIAFANPNYDGFVNMYAPWIVGRHRFDYVNVGSSTPLPLINFLTSPSDINQMLVVPFDGAWDSSKFMNTPWLIFATDPFIHKLSIQCFKTSTMSTYGEPELD